MTEEHHDGPLCVDLDGTLIKNDLSVESLIMLLRNTPWLLFLVPVWLLRGKTHLKSQIASRVAIDETVLPYNREILDLVDAAIDRGRSVYLVTGSHRTYADQIGRYLQKFDEIIATDGERNLTGQIKADLLRQKLGDNSFEYVGNAQVDIPVWEAASSIVTVDASNTVRKRAADLGKPYLHLGKQHPPFSAWIRAIRIHQWAKNFLLFVPLITAQRFMDSSTFVPMALAFLSFGLCASATYIFNDLLDLEADRHHKTKRSRPFAAGTLSATAGVSVATSMIILGAILALYLPIGFQVALFLYVLSTVLYSLKFKRIASLDVLLLAGLYTLRVIAGAFAIDVSLSFWLLAFSMFIFLCLALVKRVAELIELRTREDQMQINHGAVRGREYSTEDIDLLLSLGSSSGYLSVLVLALYINSPEVALLYATPEFLWLIAPLLLLWVTRLWMVTNRGYMHEDPILFALKDPETWITALATAVILALATLVKN